MDLGALIIVVGAGASIDALADLKAGKDVVVTLIAASFLLLILAAVGRATGQYGIVTALAFLYLLASAFTNYKNVPMLTGLFPTTSASAPAPANPTTLHPATYSA